MSRTENRDPAGVRRLFHPGRVVATRGATDLLARSSVTAARLLYRHTRGDWGDLPDDDRLENEKALVTGDRLFSAYALPDGERCWIISEAVSGLPRFRQLTTLLLPREY